MKIRPPITPTAAVLFDNPTVTDYELAEDSADGLFTARAGRRPLVTAAQLRDVVERLTQAGHWRPGDRMHPRFTHRGPWLEHAKEELPILHGTLVRLKVERLPSDRDPKPVWLWCSATAAAPADVDRWWQSFLRRFDLEHTFRLMKQTLGWTAPKVRHADTADLWTWLIIAAHTQLRLARPLAKDLRRPWERPAEPRRLTPARIRRGFRNLRATVSRPAAAPKPSRPGPGRNKHRAKHHDVGKTVKRAESIKEHQAHRG